MGNHAAGDAFANIAKALLSRRKEGESALEILDEAFERSDIGRGSDAEFDDAISPPDEFFYLITEAFGTPGVEYDDEDDDSWDQWYADVYSKFRKRYHLY